MVNWATSFHLRIWRHYHPFYSMFFFTIIPHPRWWFWQIPTSWEMFSPAMWDLTNPSREMLLELASIVHPWSDGEGVSEMFVPDALGPGEASAPNWRLTSRRCRVKVHPKVPGPGFAPGRRGPTGDRVGIASDAQERTPYQAEQIILIESHLYNCFSLGC